MMAKKTRDTAQDDAIGSNVGGILGGLSDLVQKLADLAEKGKELKASGEFPNLQGSKEMKAVYGFNVKFGLDKKGSDQIKVEPFGNVAKDRDSGRTVVHEVREPLVDVFEEDDHILVIAETPGIGPKDVKIDLKDDVLTISASKGDKKYHKEILLPRACDKNKMTISCNNGMLEIKFLS
ncbi:MAG: Hsp20/alpha crystallin family protein [Deltaproteobacteria bacterium]|nr:Hsp20/alpha crystallin family protein [Deltaproteobacteria bacterium]